MSEFEQRLARLQSFMESENARGVILSKMEKLLRIFNGGKTTVRRFGFTIDVMHELEVLLYQGTNEDAVKALKVLRE